MNFKVDLDLLLHKLKRNGGLPLRLQILQFATDRENI